MALVGPDQRPYVASADSPKDLSFSCRNETIACAAESSPALAAWRDEIWLALVDEEGAVLLGHGSPEDLGSTLAPVGQVGDTARSVSLVAWDGKLWMAGVDRDNACWLASSEDGEDFAVNYLNPSWQAGSSPSLGVVDDRLVYLVVNTALEQQIAVGDETGWLGEFTALPSSSKGTASVVDLPGMGSAEEALQSRIDAALAVLDDKEKTDAWPGAFQRLKDFADKGNADARYLVAGYFSSGTGTETDDAESLRYYRLAADQGQRSAQYLLGLSLIKGWGVEPNKPEGVLYLKLALANGDADAQGKLEELRKSGEITDADESTQESAVSSEEAETTCSAMEATLDDQDQSEAWPATFQSLKGLADRGHGRAQYLMGYYLRRGVGADQNDVEALRYTIMAAEQGQAAAQSFAGQSLYEGWDIEKNEAKGIRFLELASAQGGETAKNKLLEIEAEAGSNASESASGEASNEVSDEAETSSSSAEVSNPEDDAACCAAEAVIDDANRSTEWPGAFKTLKKLADRGHTSSCYLVGYYMSRGIGTEEDDVTGLRYYRFAADKGHANAQFRAGFALLYGIGSVPNKSLALRYLKLSAAQDDSSGKELYEKTIAAGENDGADEEVHEDPNPDYGEAVPPAGIAGVPTLHAVMVAYGTKIKVDGDVRLVRELTRTLQEYEIANIQETLLVGKNATPKKTLAAIKNIQAGPDDIVLFLFSGHGTMVDGDRELCTHYERVRRGAVSDAVRETGARLRIILSDCCANESVILPPAKVRMSSGNPSGKAARLKKLFAGYRGTFDVCSSSEHQYSFAGVFTPALIEQTLLGKAPETWVAVFEEAQKLTLARTKDLSAMSAEGRRALASEGREIVEAQKPVSLSLPRMIPALAPARYTTNMARIATSVTAGLSPGSRHWNRGGLACL